MNRLRASQNPKYPRHRDPEATIPWEKSPQNRSAKAMPRTARVAPPGLLLHITQHGNYRQQTFFTDADQSTGDEARGTHQYYPSPIKRRFWRWTMAWEGPDPAQIFSARIFFIPTYSREF
jgi:hypothetical protein